MPPEPFDELDRLYAKLKWENPRPNFTGRVMARARFNQYIQRVSAVSTIIALVVLGVFAFALGRDLTLSGALDFLVALASNFDLVTDAADDFVLALVEVLPWTEIIAVVLSALSVWLAASVLPRLLARRQSDTS